MSSTPAPAERFALAGKTAVVTGGAGGIGQTLHVDGGWITGQTLHVDGGWITQL